MNFEKKEAELKVKKAEAALTELELKIMQRQRDIHRMEEHMELQRQNIEDAKEELKKFN